MPSAYWIAFGDVHNGTGKLAEITDLQAADGIILTGDLTFNGGRAAALKVLEAVEAYNRVLAGQIGNMDRPEVTGLLRERGVNLHGEAVRLRPEVTAIGVGGSNRTPFDTPSEFSEEEIAALLRQGLAAAGDYERLILVAHAPPLNTACDRLTGGSHAGSRAVREFIEAVQPDLCLCGHIHEARGMDMIGDTPVINPGAFAEGGHIKITLKDGALEAALLY